MTVLCFDPSLAYHYFVQIVMCRQLCLTFCYQMLYFIYKFVSVPLRRKFTDLLMHFTIVASRDLAGFLYIETTHGQKEIEKDNEMC